MRERPLCRFAAAYTAGLFLACMKMPWRLLPLSFMALFCVWLLLPRGAMRDGVCIRMRARVLQVGTACIACLLGFFIMRAASAPSAYLQDAEAAGDRLTVEGTITDYEIKNEQIYYTISLEDGWHSMLAMASADSTKENELTKNTNEKTDENTDEDAGTDTSAAVWENALPIGMRVQVTGTLLFYEAPTTPGQFDLQLYYKGKNIGFALKKATLTPQNAHCRILADALRRLQLWLADTIGTLLDETDAGVLSAMLFGEKSSLDADEKALYQRNGIAHVLAVSGLHVSLIGMGLFLLLRKCGVPLSAASLLGAAAVAAFGFLSGNAVSAQRAVVMFGMMMGAKLTGRTYDFASAWSLAALLVLLRQPYALFQASMQLSFGATGAFFLFPDGLENILGRNAQYGSLREKGSGLAAVKRKFAGFPLRVGESLFLSVRLQLVTAPIQAWHFYYLTPLSGILNLLVIPGMSVLFFCGMLAAASAGLAAICPVGLLADAGYFLGRLCVQPCRLLLALYRAGCTLSEKLPGSMQIVGRPGLCRLLLYAALAAAVILLPRRFSRKREGEDRQKQKKREKYAARASFLCMLSLTVCMPFLLRAARTKEVCVTMLDVGQGDGVVLELPGDVCILSDGGSSDVSSVGAYRIVPYLMSRGIDTLALVLVSHMDADHISGVEELLAQNGQQITVQTIILPEAAQEDETFSRLVSEAEAAGVSVRLASAGTAFACGDVSLLCLAPAADYVASDTNGYSAVYRVSYGTMRMLLTGDLPTTDEAPVLAAGTDTLSAQILKIAHHGSRYSTSEAFLNAVCPKLALISCGADNSYGHPHDELLDRLAACGCDTLITAEEGAISLTLTKDGACSVTCGSQKPFAGVFDF